MMDKTININIAGTLFQIDEEAFRILRDYLQAINNRFRNVQGGHETIDDIESRIAEIFQSQKGMAGVISKANVEAMIAIIGKPEDFDHTGTETEAPVYTSQRKRMYRNPDDSIISGVCGGIGAYLNTDPVLFRILFVLFTMLFGAGFFVYIALWIALPSARTDTQKREMFGGAYHSTGSPIRQPDNTFVSSAPVYNSGYNNTSRIGNAFNEIFRALGRVCYIILRIFLIIIGVMLVLTGFLFILSFVMIFVFKYPWVFSADGFDMNFIYFPDFLNYIVSPASAPWIIALTSIAVVLPMLALIYWGVKMIFWFKAKDGIVSLAGLVLWVLSIAALSIILFNEGISFAETAKISSQNIFSHSPDTLFVKADKKVSDLKYEKELSLKREAYTVFINEEKKELYIRPHMNVNLSDNDLARVEIRKLSSGRTEPDARKRAEELLYNYSVNGDTLLLDEYLTIPSGRKWSADDVGINLYIPEGTVLKFDSASENLLHARSGFEYEEDSDSTKWVYNKRLWVLTDDGLKPLSSQPAKQK
ncbi:MAG: PspC domain-containing protein [Bacteroidetes bacterium]|nr:MAG: PspC domain-containing protein [Bacteroidota bacterium]